MNIAIKLFAIKLFATLFTISLPTYLISVLISVKPISAQVGDFCQFEEVAIAEKENLRLAAFAEKADSTKLRDYQALVKKHQQALKDCRQKSWLKTQGVWLRLYPCDLKSGKLEELMDKIVERGYNQVFVEVTTNGKVLLPRSENNTAWDSLVNSEKYEDADLLKLAIAKGRERGLKVHAWVFTMNFGLGYAKGIERNGLPKFNGDRQNAIARNANGDTTVSVIEALGKNNEGEIPNIDQLFIDPYNYQAQNDLYKLVSEVAKRKPDGIAFDYVRYKRGAGAASVVSNVRYLWIYGQASLQALRDRAQNLQGRELIIRFLKQGFVTPNDLKAVKKLYPQEDAPLWQGLRPTMATKEPPLSYWQSELWRLAVGHAFVGVTYYLNTVSKPALQQGIPSSIAFFSDGNQPVGDGFDSRMQPWHLFSRAYEWRPMAYAACGKPNCIVAQVQKVVLNAPLGAKVSPILVGQWQDLPINELVDQRPSLELQMQSIRKELPTISAISHFAFGWQNIPLTRSRQFCKL